MDEIVIILQAKPNKIELIIQRNKAEDTGHTPMGEISLIRTWCWHTDQWNWYRKSNSPLTGLMGAPLPPYGGQGCLAEKLAP